MFVSRCSTRLAGGPARTVDDADVQYQVFPLRGTARVRQASALVAVRRDEGTASTSEEEERVAGAGARDRRS